MLSPMKDNIGYKNAFFLQKAGIKINNRYQSGLLNFKQLFLEPRNVINFLLCCFFLS